MLSKNNEGRENEFYQKLYFNIFFFKKKIIKIFFK